MIIINKGNKWNIYEKLSQLVSWLIIGDTEEVKVIYF